GLDRISSGLDITYFFFFQAEDGIRDGHVTGVQTCALPIFKVHFDAARSCRSTKWTLMRRSAKNRNAARVSALLRTPKTWTSTARSEERRVGKECRFV